MTPDKPLLHVLLVEDDRENLNLLMQSLPIELDGTEILWEPCDSFEEGIRRATRLHYDVIVTDIYRDSKGVKKNLEANDRAKDIVVAVREKRFCPIVAFTDGSFPDSLREGPFLKLADKSKNNDQIITKLRELMVTGIPSIARKIHDEIDGVACPYLWEFLERNWDRLQADGTVDALVLERLVRRRVALQIGRLRGGSEVAEELSVIEGVECYIYPPVSKAIRLGEIRRKTDGTYRVVLTPHCQLVTQEGTKMPRAEHVLTVRALAAKQVLGALKNSKGDKKRAWDGNKVKDEDCLRRRLQAPAAEMGVPDGRYWPLPGFLDIPDMYCDFMQVESVPYPKLIEEHTPIAVLDTPFAESLQACFVRFYADVGLPELNPARYMHLIGQPGGTVSGTE